MRLYMIFIACLPFLIFIIEYTAALLNAISRLLKAIEKISYTIQDLRKEHKNKHKKKKLPRNSSRN